VNFPVSLEGALKLKEISYIHAEAYSGSELKHGPIAMLDNTIPVVSVLTAGPVFEKMISNCQEAKARDARVIAITNRPISKDLNTFEDILEIPECMEPFSPLLTTIPLQLLAYYMAEFLGKDVDQPRNLAKSVTVE
jgi:glucosamine--fructose-6-phosphate aminotransferase (isomerizing)